MNRLRARIAELETENRRLRLLIPLTMEEADEALKNAEPVPMDDAEIDRILDNIRRREERIARGEPDLSQSQRLALIRDKLQEIVCTEPPDDGVVLLSSDGPTRQPTPEERARGWKGEVYVHDHFSPLGDALMELWELVNDA